MGKYLKLFDNYTLYEQFMSENMILPNVSYCLDEDEVYMSKENRLIAVYDIKDFKNTKLLSSSYLNNVLEIWIDDIKQETISANYTFETIGEHSAKFLLKENVNSLENAFSSCHSLVRVIIPNGIKYTGDSTFSNCENLTNVKLPDSLKKIYLYAFHECASLIDIKIPEGVTSIEYLAFNRCRSLVNLNIPSSVTNIDDLTFGGCSNLISIKVSNDNKHYDSRNNCNAIIETAYNKLMVGCSTTVIPEGITSINNSAFSGYNNLTAITLPESITLIKNYAFVNCGLTSINIPRNVNSIGEYAFSGNNLNSITVNENNIYYNSQNNCNAIIKTSNNALIVGCASTIIPENVTLISKGAFKGNTSLTNITIPESVTSIDEEAFRECIGLTNIEIPGSVTSIKYAAFNGCINLTHILISNGVSSISSWAFSRCSMTSITLPESITSIQECAFWECNNLTSFTCLAVTPPSLGNSIFSSHNFTIYVPSASVSSYKTSWSMYASKIQAILE